jgi:hypothetical protein
MLSLQGKCLIIRMGLPVGGLLIRIGEYEGSLGWDQKGSDPTKVAITLMVLQLPYTVKL